MIIDLLSEKNGYIYSKSVVDRANEINCQLKNAEACFNNAADSYEIEASIYKIKELEMLYSSLIREAKLNCLCGEICTGRNRL